MTLSILPRSSRFSLLVYPPFLPSFLLSKWRIVMGAFPPPPYLNPHTFVQAVVSVVTFLLLFLLLLQLLLVLLLLLFFRLRLLFLLLLLLLFFFFVTALLGAEAAVGSAFPVPDVPWVVVAVGPPAVLASFVHSSPPLSILRQQPRRTLLLLPLLLLGKVVAPCSFRVTPLPCVTPHHITSSRDDVLPQLRASSSPSTLTCWASPRNIDLENEVPSGNPSLAYYCRNLLHLAVQGKKGPQPIPADIHFRP